jgi:hypothetical protein
MFRMCSLTPTFSTVLACRHVAHSLASPCFTRISCQRFQPCSYAAMLLTLSLALLCCAALLGRNSCQRFQPCSHAAMLLTHTHSLSRFAVLCCTARQDLMLGSMDADGPMQKTRSLIVDKGAWFNNAFANTPICCPSRAEIQVRVHAWGSAACYGTLSFLAVCICTWS